MPMRFSRLMRTEVNDKWEKYQPKTNILWLHYLLKKLIHEVPYKNKKTQVHKKAMKVLKQLEQDILNFTSASVFVEERGNHRD